VHERELLARETIEERGLADVGASHDSKGGLAGHGRLRRASNASVQLLAGTLQLVPVRRACGCSRWVLIAGLILSFGLTQHVLASIGGAMNFGAMSKIVDCGVSMATWGL
jgi:hypothetical protein